VLVLLVSTQAYISCHYVAMSYRLLSFVRQVRVITTGFWASNTNNGDRKYGLELYLNYFFPGVTTIYTIYLPYQSSRHDSPWKGFLEKATYDYFNQIWVLYWYREAGSTEIILKYVMYLLIHAVYLLELYLPTILLGTL